MRGSDASMLAAAGAAAAPAPPDAQQQRDQQVDPPPDPSGSSSSSSSSSGAVEPPWHAWEGSDSFGQGSGLLEPHRDSVWEGNWEGEAITDHWASLLHDRERLEHAWSTPAAAWSAANTAAMDSVEEAAAAAAAGLGGDDEGPSELDSNKQQGDVQLNGSSSSSSSRYPNGAQQGSSRYPNGFSITSSVENRAVNPGVNGQVPLGLGALPPLNLPPRMRQQQQPPASSQQSPQQPGDLNSSSSSSSSSFTNTPGSPSYSSSSSYKRPHPLVDPHPLEPSPLEPPSPTLLQHPELHEAAAQLDSERQRKLQDRQALLARLVQVIAAVEERVRAPNGAALLQLGQVFDDHPDLQQMMLENPQALLELIAMAQQAQQHLPALKQQQQDLMHAIAGDTAAAAADIAAAAAAAAAASPSRSGRTLGMRRQVESSK
ncbi:hypothetical protein OEZ86_001345 [Tetradesmus obliquus]|nr:hypothetical protein OEZ86_001345 [Tetradesmus obliquus]